MYSVARACDAGHVNTKVRRASYCNIASKAALSNSSEYFSVLFLRFAWIFFPSLVVVVVHSRKLKQTTTTTATRTSRNKLMSRTIAVHVRYKFFVHFYRPLQSKNVKWPSFA